MDFPTRVMDHQYRIDPIVRHLGDVDFYEATMGQLVYEKHFNDIATFSLINRSKVLLGEIVKESDLRDQLDFVRSLRFDKSFLIWLRGQTFYGRDGIFSQAYLDHLRTFSLPEYKLVFRDGKIEFTSTGRLCDVMWWETIIMTIVNTLRNRALMGTLSKAELDITYARGKVKLYAKLERLAEIENLNITDFGTRRRHDFLWQEHCVLTARDVLGDRFTGTSNIYLAYKHDMEAKGTNSHILPMSYAGMAGSDDAALKQSQYDVLHNWQTMYRDNMLIFLPDTFGTTQFLKDAPQWVANWKGARPDSKDPIAAGEELIAFWERMTVDPRDKLIIFADGLDVDIGEGANGNDILSIQKHFDGRVGLGFGWGTNFTNDFRNTVPNQPHLLDAISLVCKITEVNGRPTVKLSDSYSKASSTSDEEIERYREVFGDEGIANIPVKV